jgi:hypothetical protein
MSGRRAEIHHALHLPLLETVVVGSAQSEAACPFILIVVSEYVTHSHEIALQVVEKSPTVVCFSSRVDIELAHAGDL